MGMCSGADERFGLKFDTSILQFTHRAIPSLGRGGSSESFDVHVCRPKSRSKSMAS